MIGGPVFGLARSPARAAGYRGVDFVTTPETTIDDRASARDAKSGLIVGLVCYLLWGFLPVLFHALQDVGSVTIVADRTICSLVVVGAILLFRNRMPEVGTALRDPQTLRSMIISSV